MENKLKRIVATRISFMNRPWSGYNVEVWKTKVKVTFYMTDDSDFRSMEYPLNAKHGIEEIIEDQQRKLGRDVINFVGKDNMDELLEVLVG